MFRLLDLYAGRIRLKRAVTALVLMLLTSMTAMSADASVPAGMWEAGSGVGEYFDTREQMEALGITESIELLPERTRELMDGSGLGEITVDNLLQLSPKDFFHTVWEAFLEEMGKPVRALGVMLGVIVLCALLGGLREGAQGEELSRVFGIVAVLCMLSGVAAPVLDCIVSTVGSIRDASIFMLGYIPVFSAAVIASGQPMTGAAYNTFLFATCQVVSQVVSQTLLPMMSVYLALSIVGSLAPEVGISSICAAAKRIVTWSLGLVVTLFVGILSVQTMVTGSADSLSLRAGKFVVSSFVPVVGSALSEAMLAAQGCLRLIRTSVGAFGIIAAVFLILPVFLQVFGWMVVTGLAGVAADILGVKELSGLLKSCSGVMGILISFLLCYALVMIVTITVVIVAGGVS